MGLRVRPFFGRLLFCVSGVVLLDLSSLFLCVRLFLFPLRRREIMAEKKASSFSSSAIEPLQKEGGGGPLSSKGDQRGIKPLEGAFSFPWW